MAKLHGLNLHTLPANLQIMSYIEKPPHYAKPRKELANYANSKL